MKIITTTKFNRNIKSRTYPYIGYVERNGLTVLFSKPDTGTVLDIGYGPSFHAIGNHVTTWCESDFDVLDGEITLKNEVK